MTSEEVEKSMSEFFEKDTDADILIQWKTFEIKIKELQVNTVRETKRKLNDLKEKTDAQRKHRENTLYKMSKEFALKLKDKTNDETLKKEFDLFWEHSVDMIIRDTPPIKDIDIMRDVRKIYKSAPSIKRLFYSNIFSVQNYSDYVQLKKSRESTECFTNVYTSETYALSKTDEAQIR
ncbi:hypothetical protein ABG768_020370 [Culter alburnus]|uniref:Interferon-induced very large GTPase 1 domain-containing protein n=1 Tax=Culter alburnus TaxID=194366 RepID=A0AAW2B0E6_CULAL